MFGKPLELGTGIDIIEVARIHQAIDRWGESFLHYVFNAEEITYARKQRYPDQHFAARFAAKEAVFKAFGDHPHLRWKDLTVLNDEYGKPICIYKDKNFRGRILLSISHTEKYAVASAIIIHK
jgi:holo-[acyl-carrier protein] synthase